jgi:hypothetical protein
MAIVAMADEARVLSRRLERDRLGVVHALVLTNCGGRSDDDVMAAACAGLTFALRGFHPAHGVAFLPWTRVCMGAAVDDVDAPELATWRQEFRDGELSKMLNVSPRRELLAAALSAGRIRPREAEVLGGLADGKSITEIATEGGFSEARIRQIALQARAKLADGGNEG